MTLFLKRFPGYTFQTLLDEYARVFYVLFAEAQRLEIEAYLEGLDPKRRAVETGRYRDMGYNVGSDKDMGSIRGILG